MSQDRDGEGLATLGLPTLMSVLEHLPDACTLSRAVRDADGRATDMVLLWMNAAARAGQPDPAGAIGGRCSQLWPGLVENGAFAACMRVLDTGVPERGEFDWTEATTYRASYYDWRATRVEGDLLLWVLRDASDRIHRVLASEARLHAILRTAPDAIIVIDERGVVVDSNAACEHLLGWTPDALIGQSVSALMADDDAEKHGDAIDRYLRTGVRHIIGTGREVVARRRDGSTIPVRLSVGEARVGGRRLFTGILHDLTQQHALSEQLRNAQRMQTAGRLVSRVAHDFNNLLTIMTTTASLLEHMVEDPEARTLLGEIVDAAQRGSALNRQLLSTTRAEVQTPSVIDVNELLQSTTKLARRLVGSGIHVDVDLRAGGWAVRADANALGCRSGHVTPPPVVLAGLRLEDVGVCSRVGRPLVCGRGRSARRRPSHR